MGRCMSFITWRDRCFRYSFSNAGLKSTTTDLGDGTIMHCWAPKAHNHSNRSLLLIHGIGANAMWQWNYFISSLTRHFNVYVPDLLFFGHSYTTRPERSEWFQAKCVMALLQAHGVHTMTVVGLSYGGFVAYSMAVLFPKSVEKLVVCCAGVCLEDKDMDEGMFKVMCTEYRQERKELIQALHKDRKVSNLPKITQPLQIIWGEQDQVFPLELAQRLKRHVGEKAQLVVIKNAGHAINAEKPKELYKNLKSFLIDPLTPSKQESHSNDHKMDQKG
ncbi:monoacylglycerol lipase abhd6-A-like isoform X3 [Abrus precatorius]|uniref:Monoacylglycerol lipase abhd6-A-like isoform X3 n=1 Tax=Abrus precatorius TaxID=3816 RepID=A0A8B8K3J0_ABRPR|nr:monoacylglycerol lipase abhd6-A-like isoform X3 [Abrus precatorius]